MNNIPTFPTTRRTGPLMMRMISRFPMMRMIFTDLFGFSTIRMIFKPVSRFSLGGQDHLGDPGLPRERLDGGLGQQVDPQVEMMNNNIVCNIFILSGKTNQDCKDKDGNNPVTLGLENMRGVSTIVITINLGIISIILLSVIYITIIITINLCIVSIILRSVMVIIRCLSWSALG